MPSTCESGVSSKRPTDDVLERAYPEDRVLVTKNVEDFVKLARACDLHPGILLLEDGDLVRDEQLRVVRASVALLGPERDSFAVNRVLRVWADGRHVFQDIPVRV